MIKRSERKRKINQKKGRAKFHISGVKSVPETNIGYCFQRNLATDEMSICSVVVFVRQWTLSDVFYFENI